MAALETLKGTITSLARNETAPDVVFEFDVRLEDRRSRRAQWLAMPGYQLREGDLVTVTGSTDANGILVVKTLTIIPPPAAPRQVPWLLLSLPWVALVTTWSFAVFITPLIGGIVVAGAGAALLYAASKQARRPVRLMLQTIASSMLITVLAIQLGAGFVLFVTLCFVSAASVCYAIYLLIRRHAPGGRAARLQDG